MMIGIDLGKFPEFASCLEFVENLAMEQSVLAFPGPCFDFPSYFRFVLTVPEDMIIEACQRIQEFCYDHFKDTENIAAITGDSYQWKINELHNKRFTGARVSRAV